MKAWFKSKTMWIGFAMGFLGLLQTTLETAPLPEAWAGPIMGAFGVVTMVLRTVTTTAIGAGDE